MHPVPNVNPNSSLLPCSGAPSWLIGVPWVLTSRGCLWKMSLAGHSVSSQLCLAANKLCGQEVQQSEAPITAEESLIQRA